MEISALDWFGYIATITVLVSLLMSNIIKLRFFNLIGSILFSSYGFMIGSIPTGVLNLLIVVIDLYYLYKILHTNENFNIIEADANSKYFKHFIKTNANDLKKVNVTLDIQDNSKVFYLLRNNNTVGILAGVHISDDIFFVNIDYVTKQYRDFKIGKYIFSGRSNLEFLKDYKEVQTKATTKEHINYLLKVGFTKSENDKEDIYIKKLS